MDTTLHAAIGSKFHLEEQLWLSLYTFSQLVPLFGMHFLLLYALLFFQSVFRLHMPLLKPIFLMGPCTLAASLNGSSH